MSLSCKLILVSVTITYSSCDVLKRGRFIHPKPYKWAPMFTTCPSYHSYVYASIITTIKTMFFRVILGYTTRPISGYYVRRRASKALWHVVLRKYLALPGVTQLTRTVTQFNVVSFTSHFSNQPHFRVGTVHSTKSSCTKQTTYNEVIPQGTPEWTLILRNCTFRI